MGEREALVVQKAFQDGHGGTVDVTWLRLMPGVNGYVCPPDEDSYARMILDILAAPETYERVSAAARHDLYLNWDDVVRDVYDDYNTFVAARHRGAVSHY